MKTLVIDSQVQSGNKYDISVVSKKDWDKFIKSVLLARVENVKSLKIFPTFITIRDNRAKVKMSWEDNNYHEFTFHINEFGRESKNYQDIVSEIWQNIMADYYFEEYVDELNSQLKSKEI